MPKDIADLPIYIQNRLIEQLMESMLKYYMEEKYIFHDEMNIETNMILTMAKIANNYDSSIRMKYISLYISKNINTLNDSLMYGYNAINRALRNGSIDSLLYSEFSKIILPRIFEIDIYLSEKNDNIINGIDDHMDYIMTQLNIDIIKVYDPIINSWFKRWIVVTKNALTKAEFVEKMEKIERAAELEYIHLRQSNIDKSHAEGIAALIQSIQDVPSAILLVGSSLIVKQSTPNSAILVRTLSQQQLIRLEEHPILLSRPDDIINALFSNDNSPKNDDNLLRGLIIDSD